MATCSTRCQPGSSTTLAGLAGTHRVHYNRSARKHDALSSVAVNANAIDIGNGIFNPFLYSYTGAGVTVAFIDSGITSYAHPDLADSRLLAFVDFVNGSSTKYDDNGHGTHVAGVINGSGKLSAKKYAGMAPGASLVSLKVLNQDGVGTVGNILKALDWVYKYGKNYGIRVVNLSVGAAVTESYYTDPLTLAAKTLVDSGITVVAAAGNNGQNALGQPQWGGVVSPAQRALGAHGLRVQHPRHLQRCGRQGRRLQLVGPDRRRLHARSRTSARLASAWSRRLRLGAACSSPDCSRCRRGCFRGRCRPSTRISRTKA